MLRKIKNFVDETSVDFLVGGSYVLAFIVGYIGYTSGFDSTEIGLFVSVGLILVMIGLGFAFSLYKQEYPLYFKLRLKGRPAQVFSTFWLIITWGLALILFLAPVLFI